MGLGLKNSPCSSQFHNHPLAGWRPCPSLPRAFALVHRAVVLLAPREAPRSGSLRVFLPSARLASCDQEQDAELARVIVGLRTPAGSSGSHEVPQRF